jgi:hypothetical protein
MVQKSLRGAAFAAVFAALVAWGTGVPARSGGRDGRTYETRADASAFRYTSADGHTIAFGRPEVSSARARWCGRAVEPAASGDQVSYDHGNFTELYQLRPDGVQQAFVLKEKLDGPAGIRIPVRSALVARAADADTVEFRDGSGTARLAYHDAFAMDREGRIARLTITAEKDVLAIHLPADYLATAAFPVLVDPLVGDPEYLSPTGAVWRMPGVHIMYNPTDNLYLTVWHRDVIYNDPPNNHGHPAHEWLTNSYVDARAVRIAADGSVTFGPIANIGPVTANFCAAGPRGTWCPATNQFMVAWSEGRWEVTESPDVDTDGDGLVGTDPDRNSLFGDIVTDLDDNDINEYPVSQDPFAPNTRVTGRMLAVNPATLALATVGAPVEVSMAANGVPGNPGGTNPAAIHPAVLPDVSWDGAQYVVVWQTLEDPQLGELEDVGSTHQLRHVFRTKNRARLRTFTSAGAASTAFIDLSNAKERFFIKGPTDVDTNIIDGSVPANLSSELIYDSVATDLNPRVASLILPGADNTLGTADDTNLGSLIVWSVTSLVFNEPKSRIRGRMLPAGGVSPGIVWDVFDADGQILQRAAVAAGASRQADNPLTPLNETVTTSGFMVVFQRVDDVIYVGSRAVEYIGAIEGRMAEENGVPGGPLIPIAMPSPAATYMSPSVAWSRENAQYFLAWTMTETTLYNPVTQGRAWFPTGWTMLDSPSLLFSSLATVYPQGASATANAAAVNPSDPALANHHVMFVGQEDDFGANYTRRYKFPPAPATTAPTISLTPSTLSFATPDAGTPMAPQSVTLLNSGGTGSLLEWNATADQSWLSVGPSSGALAGGSSTTLTIGATPIGLTDGVYVGTVSLIAPTATNSPQSIAVTMVIGTATSGVDGFFASPPSVSLSVPAGTAQASATLTVTFNDADANPASVLWSVTSALPSWLAAVTPAGGTLVAPSSSTILSLDFDTQGLAPGVYNTTLVLVTSPAVPGSPRLVPVQLTVVGSGAPPPGGGGGDDDDGRSHSLCGGSAASAAANAIVIVLFIVALAGLRIAARR